jgi:hypothetical protein
MLTIASARRLMAIQVFHIYDDIHVLLQHARVCALLMCSIDIQCLCVSSCLYAHIVCVRACVCVFVH